jgi:uncharacterized protein (TIGR03067 family)
MTVKLLAVVLAGSLALADDAKKADARKELDGFQGTWQFVAEAIDGSDVAQEQLQQMTFTVRGDKYTVRFGDQLVQSGTLKPNPATKPKSFDGAATQGDGEGSTLLGIYEFSGDTLRFCFDPKGKKRPAEFKSAQGSGLIAGTVNRRDS